MIKANDITKSYGDFKALDNVTMHVKKGSVYGLVGPNGAGKTTLIKVLTGIYKPDNGLVTVLDKPIFENNEVKQRVAYISDDLYFYPMYSTKQMAAFYADTYEDFSYERYEKIKKVLKINEKARLSKLSKGMRKQVAFWLAISTKPDVMILDEPVDGLDPVMRRLIWSILMQDVADREMTVLISSHNLRELEDVCDHVGIIHEGKIMIERDLDHMKSDIHKIQIAFENTEKNFSLPDSVTMLKEEFVGRVKTLILKGEKELIREVLMEYKPIFIEFIPLTLEEIFIYELGGMGYEDQRIEL